MNLLELKKAIAGKQIPKLNIFFGEEQAVLDIYIEDICKQFDIVIKQTDVESVGFDIGGTSLFSDSKSRRLFIVKYDQSFVSNESAWGSLETELEDSDVCVILKYSKIDAKTKFYKHFTDSIVEFTKMSTTVIAKHISNDYGIQQNYAEHLASICDCNYGRVLAEMDTIQCYSEAMNISLEEAYKDCYTAGIIYIDPSGSMFDLCNCILDGNVQQIQSEFQKFKDRGDNILGLVSVLSNTVKAIIQVKSFINDTRGICEKTGLQQYAVQNVKKYAKLYKNETLIKLMRKLLLIEKSIKNGELDSAFAVDYTVVSILGVIYFGY